jgi:hypothetical protein
MTGLDATIARALSGYNAGDVLSFDSLREAANAAHELEPVRRIEARVAELAALAQGDSAQTGGE